MRVLITFMLLSQLALAELQNIQLPNHGRCQANTELTSSLPCAAKAELLIFVSMSMPDTSLQQLFAQAQRLGGRLILKGLVNNSFKATQQKIMDLQIIVDIDPTLFEKYQVSQVPTFVKGGHKLLGNVSAEFAVNNITKSGVHGATFKIAEISLLELIEQRLQQLDQHTVKQQQLQIQTKIKQSIESPKPVTGLKLAQKYRRKTYDPSTKVTKNILDQSGRVVVKAGTKINPLDYVSFGQALTIIDAADTEQVNWAKRQNGLIVLVNGRPLQLEQQLQVPVYFDQGGRIVARFGIQALPAKVSQQGKLLVIEELAL